MISYDEALALLKEYNQGEFHLKHAYIVSDVMGWFAEQLGYGEEKEFWSIVGLLHDLDFEQYPDQHCVKSQEIMRARGVDEAIIHATASHGYGITVDIQPEHQMEKVLFATDELTGLIGAAAIMRPSKSVSDLEVKSVKKKFKDKKFAAGCSREVILQGAEMLGWDLDHLIDQTIQAMRASSHGGTGMKKLCLGVLLCALLLCSCQGNTDQGTQDATSYGETIAKAQTVQVLDSAGQTVNTLSTQEDLTAFVENLDLAHWTYQALPEEVQPLGSFVLFQENTIQLGQTEPDGWTELCRITLYSEHCLTLEILDLALPFTVAAETGERLASYF